MRTKIKLFVTFVLPSSGVLLVIFYTIRYGFCQIRQLDVRTNAIKNSENVGLNPTLLSRHLEHSLFNLYISVQIPHLALIAFQAAIFCNKINIFLSQVICFVYKTNSANC